MANRYCTKCGKEVVAGKRFCGGCGQAMPVVATTIVEDVAAAPACMYCGAALAPGKRFCKQCGQPIDATTDVRVFEQPSSAPAPVDLPVAAVKEPAPKGTDHAPTVIMETPYTERAAPESASASQWKTVIEPAPSRTASLTAVPAYEPLAEPHGQSTTRIVLLAVGLAVAVLAAAGGGWAWYVHEHRSASSGAGPATQAPQTTPQPTVQEQASATPGTTEPEPKLPAGVPVPASPQTQQTPPHHAPSVPIQPQSSSQSGHGNPAAPTPAFHPTPASPVQLPAQNTQGRSGVRHYQGQPVPHGGTVVFDNFPKARLKFTFDHALWQLTIKSNPDGTKKITMISLAQGSQSSCDLGWEIIE
ncbi:MAG: zinc ribbon domain-containing protein [Terracidiphilus sp.]